MKICFKCGVEKPLSEFYRHPMMADGHLGKCKECNKADVRANRAARSEYYRDYDRARANRPDRVEARRSYAERLAAAKTPKLRKVRKNLILCKREWMARNADKHAAHVILGNAVRDGRVIKGPCERCGSTTRIHGHHDDYGKPLKVRWLCPKHHGEVHKEIRCSAKSA
jgi:hypothetical protein